MKKIMIIVCCSLLLFANFAFGQNWEFDKLLIDLQLPQDNGWGVHGVAVAPDGNIWIALYGNLAQDTVFTAAGDTINIRPIYVLDPNGNHVSFSPIRWLEFPDATVDTLHADSPINGSGNGISVDNDGNILYTSWTTLYRINYQTGQAMNRFTPTDMSSSTEAVQDANGNIYLGYVISAERPVYMLDNNFNLIGNAIDTLGHINRTLAVTPDGKDLYAGSTWNGFGIEHWHSDVPGLDPFTVVDTLGNWDSVYDPVGDTTYTDVKLWASCLDWGPDGMLWAGNLRSDWSGPGANKGSMYYAFDVTTGLMVDSVGVALGDSSAGGLYSPRGAAWSADGNTMYLADFDYNIVGVWTRTPTGIETVQNVPLSFNLLQNYPNPFNPTTTIPFTLVRPSFVELKVYNTRGQLVKTLINEPMNQGSYKIKFDATGLASGVYHYRLKIDGTMLTRRMTFMK